MGVCGGCGDCHDRNRPKTEEELKREEEAREAQRRDEEERKRIQDLKFGPGRWTMSKGPLSPKDLMRKNLTANPSPTPITGNLYKFLAFGMQQTCYELAGLLLIVFIQILAPVVIMCWAVYELDWGESLTSESVKSLFEIHYGADDHNCTAFLTRLLGLAFFICFIMSGRECLRQDQDNWEKVMKLLTFLLQTGMEYSKVTWSWLVIGPAINTYIVVVICVDMLFLLLLAEGPKDIVFDALGLLFLWRLDDVGGDLGFLSEKDWNAENFAAYYEENDADEIDLTKKQAKGVKETGFWWKFGMSIYYVGDKALGVSLVLLPILLFGFSGLGLKKSET